MPRIGTTDLKEPVAQKIEEVVVLPKDTTAQEQHTYGRHPADLSTDEELKKVSGKSSLGTFCAYPTHVHFAGQLDDEEIILLLRAHVVTNVPWILWGIGAALVPVLLLWFLNLIGVLAGVSAGLVTVLTLYWYMGIFTYAFTNVLFWYFNVGIVTNERVVDIDWNSLTDRDVSTAQIGQIQSIKAVLAGVIAGIFDFGSVFVETAGNDPNIEFLNVPHAQLVVRKMQELMQAEEIERETK